MKRIIIFALSILILTQAYAFSQADAQSRADHYHGICFNCLTYLSNRRHCRVYGSVSFSSDPLRAYDVALIVKHQMETLLKLPK